MTIGDRLRAARRRRGWSQTELARRSKISQSTIWRIENGVIPQPKMDVVIALAKALEVDLAELVPAIASAKPQDEGVDIDDEALDLALKLARKDRDFPMAMRVDPDKLTPEAKLWIIRLYERATQKRLL